jgi:plastocyanin
MRGRTFEASWRLGVVSVVTVLAAFCGPTGYHVASADPAHPPDPLIEQLPYATSPYVMPSASQAIAASTGNLVSQASNTVRIVDFAFNPSSVTVPAGTTVTWTNTGMATHTSTSDNGVWNSGPIRPGASFAQTFSNAGNFSYHCMIHPFMTGTITVTASTSVATSPSIAAVNASGTQAVSISEASGWNLVGGPEGSMVSAANGPLYTFRAGDSSYESLPSTTPFVAGVGYWAYFNSPTTEVIPAAGLQPASIPLPARQWVMVGNPSGSTVRVSGADSLLTYSGIQGYQPATTLAPGQGAWAWSSTGGTLALASG